MFLLILLFALAALATTNYYSATAREYTAEALVAVGSRIIDLGECLIHAANKLEE